MKTLIRIVGDIHISDSTPRSWATDYFENCLSELELVCSGADVVICLGDFFDKPTVSEQCKARLIRKLDAIANSGTKIYTIVGNHDIISYNMGRSLYERTTLNLLQEIERINIIEDTGLTIEGVTFYPYNGSKGNVLTKVKKSGAGIKNILLAHTFLDNDLDEILNLTSAEVKKAGYDLAFFGHDHEPHPDKDIFRRPGAFSRNSSHKYNLTRKPAYYEITLGANETLIEKKTLESALSSEQLFREEAFIKENNKDKIVFLGNLDEMFKTYKTNVKKDVLSLSKVLSEIEAPETVVGYLKEQHINNNVNWQ